MTSSTKTIRAHFMSISLKVSQQIQTIKHHIKTSWEPLLKPLLTALQNQLTAQTVGRNWTSVHCFTQLLNRKANRNVTFLFLRESQATFIYIALQNRKQFCTQSSVNLAKFTSFKNFIYR